MKLIYKIALLLTVFSTNAQIHSYYQSIDFNLRGEALKNQLSNLITITHNKELVYTPEVWNVLKLADLNPHDPSKVLLMYGFNDTDNIKNNDRSRNKTASCHSSNCEDKWVREHVFPRSKGTPNLEFEGPGSDAHHLRAVDYDRNSMRSNFKFIANPTPYITYSRVIQQNGVDYFYPGDEWKGDVARMIMYMYVRYGNQCQPINVGYGSTSYSNFGDMPNIFLQWNAEDPVSEFEINRNEYIYQAQGNRNPFIDNAYLATMIWNGPAAKNEWTTLDMSEFDLTNVTIYPTISSDFIYISTDIQDIDYQIFDTTGKMIIEHTDKTINISNLQNGIYFLKLNNLKQQPKFKFIKR